MPAEASGRPQERLEALSPHHHAQKGLRSLWRPSGGPRKGMERATEGQKEGRNGFLDGFRPFGRLKQGLKRAFNVPAGLKMPCRYPQIGLGCPLVRRVRPADRPDRAKTMQMQSVFAPFRIDVPTLKAVGYLHSGTK